MAPTNPLAVVFANPLVSVLPRVLMGWAVGLFFHGLYRVKPGRAAVWAALSGALGAILNAAMVLPAAYLASSQLFLQYMVPESSYLLMGILTLMATNTLPEAVFGAILVPAIYMPLRKAFPHMMRINKKIK
jgi:uncharacterized membrane protein